MKNLHWKLLIPLIFLSGLSFFLARSFNPSIDYSSIFLNLTTDFVMVIVTIYYIDHVVKENENERWKRVDYSIVSRISFRLLDVIMNVCKPFITQSLIDEIYPKLYNPRGTPPTVESLYFILKMSEKPTPDFKKKYEMLTETDQARIYDLAKNCSFIFSETLTLYGNRLPPDLLLAIVDTQELMQLLFHESNEKSYQIYLLLKELKKIVEITGFERLENYMEVNHEPSELLHKSKLK